MSPYRLVVHLVLALVLYAAILWTGLSCCARSPHGARSQPAAARAGPASCVLVGLTIVAGGFVAGTHAGFDYNTFPLMDGRLVPEGYARLQPGPAEPDREHRGSAVRPSLAGDIDRPRDPGGGGDRLRPGRGRGVRRVLLALGAVVAVQYALGVATLLAVVPVDLAVAHQCTAVLLLDRRARARCTPCARPQPLPPAPP